MRKIKFIKQSSNRKNKNYQCDYFISEHVCNHDDSMRDHVCNHHDFVSEHVCNHDDIMSEFFYILSFF